MKVITLSLLFSVAFLSNSYAQLAQGTLENEGSNVVEVFAKPTSTISNGLFGNIDITISIANQGASNPTFAQIGITSLIPSLDIHPADSATVFPVAPTPYIIAGRVYYSYIMTATASAVTTTWTSGVDNPVALFNFGSLDPSTVTMELVDESPTGGPNTDMFWYVQVNGGVGDVTDYAQMFYGTGKVNAAGLAESEVPLQALVLPVNFTSFTVIPGEDGTTALLNWKASGEGSISKDYEVERSVNGGVNYTTIDTVAITSPDAISNSYNYTDNITSLKPVNNTIYYRIKQIDYDGKSTYTLVQDLHLADAVSTLDLNVYPNPVLDYANVGFNLGADAVATIDVTNVNGQLVQSSQVQGLQGANKASVNFSSLVAGNYMLTLKIGSDVHTISLIKH